MKELARIKAAPDRVATQEMDQDGRVERIVWRSAKLGLEVVEPVQRPNALNKPLAKQTREKGE